MPETPDDPKPKSRRPLEFPSVAYVEERAAERTARLGGGQLLLYSLLDTDGVPATYDEMVLAVRKRRRLQVKPAIPSYYKSTAKDVRAGQVLVHDAISRVSATLTAGERRLLVIPENKRQVDMERAVNLKRWTTAVLLGDEGRPSRLQREAGEPWFELGIDQVVQDGRCIWELVRREDAWSELYGHPRRGAYDADDNEAYNRDVDRFLKRATFPFRILRVDPLAYDEWRLDGKAVEAIKIEYRPKSDVYPQYGLRHEDKDGPTLLAEPYAAQEMPAVVGRTLARCMTFWRADPIPNEQGVCPVVWVYIVDGQLVDKGETDGPPWHPLPFFLFYGVHTSLPDAQFKGVAMTFYLLRLCDAIDTLMSMKFNVAALSSLPAWFKTTPEGGTFDLALGAAGAAAVAGGAALPGAGHAGTFRIEPGMGYEGYPGQDIKAIVPPQNATVILDSLKADLMDFVQLVGLPAVMRGNPSGTGGVGYLAAQMIAAAKIALAPAIQNAADTLTGMAQYLWWQVEHHFPEGVPTFFVGKRGRGSGWVTLKPEDIDGFYDCQVTLEPLLPVDKIQQAEASLRQVEARAISMRRHREDGLQLDSPEEEEEAIEAEEARAHPLIALPRKLMVATRLGYITPEEAAQIRAKEFGLPAPSVEQAPANVLLGPNGQPLPPTAGNTPGVPQPSLPELPGLPGQGLPLIPTPPNIPAIPANPSVAGLAPEGGVGVPGPLPDYAAQVTGREG